jgi:hypothetical protein
MARHEATQGSTRIGDYGLIMPPEVVCAPDLPQVPRLICRYLCAQSAAIQLRNLPLKVCLTCR